MVFVLFLKITESGEYDFDFDCVTVPVRLSYLSSFDVVRNSNKDGNYTVEDVEDGYLQIIFTGPANTDLDNDDGFYFRNYSYTSNTYYYDLYVEDYQVIRPNNLSDTTNWGFYNGSTGSLSSSGSYIMESKNDLRTADANILWENRGSVLFGISDSYRSGFPLIVKIKANIIYV